MPNIKSAIKRQETELRDKERNKALKSELATGLKKINKLIDNGEKDAAINLLPKTTALLDEMVTKGIIHKNKADRQKATLAAKIDKLSK